MFAGPFRAYEEPETKACIRDLTDGYFPSELQRKYPDGWSFLSSFATCWFGKDTACTRVLFSAHDAHLLLSVYDAHVLLSVYDACHSLKAFHLKCGTCEEKCTGLLLPSF